MVCDTCCRNSRKQPVAPLWSVACTIFMSLSLSVCLPVSYFAVTKANCNSCVRLSACCSLWQSTVLQTLFYGRRVDMPWLGWFVVLLCLNTKAKLNLKPAAQLLYGGVVVVFVLYFGLFLNYSVPFNRQKEICAYCFICTNAKTMFSVLYCWRYAVQHCTVSECHWNVIVKSFEYSLAKVGTTKLCNYSVK